MVGVTGSIPVPPTIQLFFACFFRCNEAPGRQVPPAMNLGEVMKVRNSLKSLRARHRDNRVVRRKGRLYIINKTQKRFKARQG